MKFVFTPISILGGLVVGQIAKKIFQQIWGWIDDDEPPEPKHRDIALVKLAFALLLEGAIFRLVRGFFDQGARRAFAKSTGTWPGQERPEPE